MIAPPLTTAAATPADAEVAAAAAPALTPRAEAASPWLEPATAVMSSAWRWGAGIWASPAKISPTITWVSGPACGWGASQRVVELNRVVAGPAQHADRAVVDDPVKPGTGVGDLDAAIAQGHPGAHQRVLKSILGSSFGAHQTGGVDVELVAVSAD
jgi:hypothetical protein